MTAINALDALSSAADGFLDLAVGNVDVPGLSDQAGTYALLAVAVELRALRVALQAAPGSPAPPAAPDSPPAQREATTTQPGVWPARSRAGWDRPRDQIIESDGHRAADHEEENR